MELDKLKIRKLISKDIEEVVSLGIKEKSFSTENGAFWTSEQLNNWSQSSNDVLLVAEYSGKIIGFTLFACHIPTKKVTWENLVVGYSYRNQGVAKLLLEHALELLTAMGYVYIMGCMNTSDKDNFLNFAERYGFKKGPTVLWFDKVIKQ